MTPHLFAEKISYQNLVDRAVSLIKPGSRAILGITGAPGSGKSTLAAAVATSVNERFNKRGFGTSFGTPDSTLSTDKAQRELARADALTSATKQATETAKTGAGAATRAETEGPRATAATHARRRVSPAIALPIPMDGFHLSHSVLEERGHVSRKGALHTFDDWGFLSLLQRIKAADHTVYAPQYRREIEEPIAGAIPVDPDIPLIIVEGNYLLAEGPGWSQVREYLTESWFITLDEDVRLGRLIDRHKRYGRSQEAATRHALGSDQQNALLINETAVRADLVIDIQNW